MSPRKLIYNIMVSLDGYMEGPGGNLNWPVIDEELHTFVNREEEKIGLWLYGRRMYELMNASWPTADQNPASPAYVAEFARIYRAKPKVVFSRTVRQMDDPRARLAVASPQEEVRRLKAENGPDIEVSGTELASSLIQEGLVDEFMLYIHPVILGGGRKAFPNLEQLVKLTLYDSRAFNSGVIFLHYRAVY